MYVLRTYNIVPHPRAVPGSGHKCMRGCMVVSGQHLLVVSGFAVPPLRNCLAETSCHSSLLIVIAAQPQAWKYEPGTGGSA